MLVKAESADRTAKIAGMICKSRKGRASSAFGYSARICSEAPMYDILLSLERKFDMLHKLAKTGASKTNVCRNLHRLLQKTGVQYPVAVDSVTIHIKLRKPRPHSTVAQWPVVRMSTWAKALLKDNARYLLGGNNIEDVAACKMVYENFWESYRTVDEHHPVFATGVELGRVVPYALHGDEGRGLRGKPYLVESWQPIIGVAGPDYTNESSQLALFATFGI